MGTKHLLVTNDFPPKVGGIQAYLWELWRRLPPDDVTVLTTPYEGDAAFDAEQAFRVVRTRQGWLLPTKKMVRQINELAEEVDAKVIVLDPASPLGLVGPKLNRPYVLVGHGAEYVIQARMPVLGAALARTTRGAAGLIGAGDYVTRAMQADARSATMPVAVIPPGVDIERFVPIDDVRRSAVRRSLGVAPGSLLVVGVSRLVPRKGFDRVIRAAAMMPGVEVLIAGKGRESKRLTRLIDATSAPVRLLGRVEDADLPDLYAAADVFAMPCHDRWFGLEQEGYGIVFLEAAAAGVASIAGTSGGSAEAVVDGETGVIVPGSAKPGDIARALRSLQDEGLRRRLGAQGRRRVEAELSYDRLAERLDSFLSRFDH